MRKYLIILCLFTLTANCQMMESLYRKRSMTKWGDYQLGKIITIKQTNISSSLTDFPVYVKCDNTIMGALIDQTHFYDIRFTDTLNNILPYQADSVNSTTGNYWVKTSLSATASNPTRIYCYYKNSVAQTDGSSTSTWDSYYSGVWHFKNGASLNVSNSTANALTTTNSGATSQTGAVDGGAGFSSQYAYVNDATVIDLERTDHFTFEFWIKSSQTATAIILEKMDGSLFYKGVQFCLNCTANKLTHTLFGDNSTNKYIIITSNATVNDNAWHHICLSYTGNSSATGISLYVDGLPDSFSTDANTLGATSIANTQAFNLGRRRSTNNLLYNGYLDELRISKGIDRSAAWAKFEYNNMNSADHELTWTAL